MMLPFLFILQRAQIITLILLINRGVFVYIIWSEQTTTWAGYWFFITYNRGILVILIYLVSISPYEKGMLRVYIIALLVYKYRYRYNEITATNYETHFWILEYNIVGPVLIVLTLLLLFTSKTINAKKTPSRIL